MPRPAAEAPNGTLARVRAWVLMVLGVLLIVYGLTVGHKTPSAVMLGFAVIGGEPVWRAGYR